MRSSNLGRERLNIASWAMVFLFMLTSQLPAAQQQVSPAITVTVNKSMVFRLAERAKRI